MIIMEMNPGLRASKTKVIPIHEISMVMILKIEQLCCYNFCK